MKKKYYELLPRKIPARSLCQHLNSDGSRCKDKAKWEITYHGNPEFETGTTWVAIKMCYAHAVLADDGIPIQEK